ncbi:MAG: hypothetical protein H5U02_15320 [Clostridia bacterium]|nr:hypothetical protein [Clostridia bacterium]
MAALPRCQDGQLSRNTAGQAPAFTTPEVDSRPRARPYLLGLQAELKAAQNWYGLDREADWFAKNFLMPEQWVRNEARILSPHGEPLLARELGWLKEIFDVSWEALMVRLEELGIQDRCVSEEQLGITHDLR